MAEKKWLLTSSLALALLYGCADDAMTNDQIIAEVQKCEKTGMRSVAFSNLFDFKTRRIECATVPNEPKSSVAAATPTN